VGSGAVMYSYIPSFIKIRLGVQKLMMGGYTDSMVIHNRTFIFFKIKKNRLKCYCCFNKLNGDITGTQIIFVVQSTMLLNRVLFSGSNDMFRPPPGSE
jgi:hypothetical protein